MRRERGLSPSIEAAVLIPGLVMLVILVVVLARIVLAQHDVQAVAAAAARAASMARTAGEGKASALEEADRGRDAHRLACRPFAIDIDDQRAGQGSPGSVTVTVRCGISLGDVGLPLVSHVVDVEGRAVSPVDSHREG